MKKKTYGGYTAADIDQGIRNGSIRYEIILKYMKDDYDSECEPFYWTKNFIKFLFFSYVLIISDVVFNFI